MKDWIYFYFQKTKNCQHSWEAFKAHTVYQLESFDNSSLWLDSLKFLHIQETEKDKPRLLRPGDIVEIQREERMHGKRFLLTTNLQWTPEYGDFSYV